MFCHLSHRVGFYFFGYYQVQLLLNAIIGRCTDFVWSGVILYDSLCRFEGTVRITGTWNSHATMNVFYFLLVILFDEHVCIINNFNAPLIFYF